MDTSQIIAQLKSERAKIDAAISALELLDGTRLSAAAGEPITRKPGKVAGEIEAGTKPAKRKISPTARKKMSEAAKARWAQRKKAGKKSL